MQSFLPHLQRYQQLEHYQETPSDGPVDKRLEGLGEEGQVIPSGSVQLEDDGGCVVHDRRRDVRDGGSRVTDSKGTGCQVHFLEKIGLS